MNFRPLIHIWYAIINIIRYDRNVLSILYPGIEYDDANINTHFLLLRNENLEKAAEVHITDICENEQVCPFQHDTCSINCYLYNDSCHWYDRISYYVQDEDIKSMNRYGEVLLASNHINNTFQNLKYFLFSKTHKNIILEPSWDYIGMYINEKYIAINFAAKYLDISKKNKTQPLFESSNTSYNFYLVDEISDYIYFILFTNTPVPSEYYNIDLIYNQNTYHPVYIKNERLFVYRTAYIHSVDLIYNVSYIYNIYNTNNNNFRLRH